MGKDLKGKELGQGIRQRKNGRYSARFVDRFGKRREVYGDTLKEVKNKLAVEVNDDYKRKNLVDENIKLNEWYEKWMKVYKIPVVRKSTIRIYQHVYNTFIKNLIGNIKLKDISRLMTTDVLNEANRKGYSWEVQNQIRRVLVDMFNRALEDEFVIRNPAKGVRIPINKPQNLIKAISREDQKDFFECSSGTFYHNLFVVAINTGLRPGELCALDATKDIDFKNKEIIVNKTLIYDQQDGNEQKTFRIGPPKTDSSYRRIPMNKICENAILRQIRQKNVVMCKTCKKDKIQFPNLLFTTKFGTPINSEIYSEAIGRIVNEVNLCRDPSDEMEKFAAHDFRHTFATRCFEAGVPPKTVQTYLGHATLDMTMNLYTSVLEKKKFDDMKLLEDSIDIEIPDVSGYEANSKIIKFCG